GSFRRLLVSLDIEPTPNLIEYRLRNQFSKDGRGDGLFRLLNDPDHHQEKYIENFETRRIQFRRDAETNPAVLVFNAIEQAGELRGLADSRMPHDKSFERDGLVCLLQFSGKTGDCILATNLVYLTAVEPVQIFLVDERIGSKRQVKI